MNCRLTSKRCILFWKSYLCYLFSEDLLQALCLSMAWLAFLLQLFPPFTIAKMEGSSSDVMEVQLVINSEALNYLLLLTYVVNLSIVSLHAKEGFVD